MTGNEAGDVVRRLLWHPEPTDPSEPFLSRLLRTMVEEKRLPKYQFERRVDALLALFLPDALSRVLGGDVEHVVPEFPIKVGKARHSANVDRLMYIRAEEPGSDRWVFVEIKTDRNSIDHEQIERYLEAIKKGMPRLLADIPEIRKGSKEKCKYSTLLARLHDYEGARPIELIYLTNCPEKLAAYKDRMTIVTFEQLAASPVQRYAAEWQLFRELVIDRALLS